MNQLSKKAIFLWAIFFMLTQMACNKNCDLGSLSGSWTFVQNGDHSTEYIGTIEKSNDNSITVKFDSIPSAVIVLNGTCQNGVTVYDEERSLGNHGHLKVTGSSTASRIDFYFNEVNFVFKREGTISGTKNN